MFRPDVQLGAMWVENWKVAHFAQRQLSDDVAAIEFENDLQRAANAQVVDVLSRCIGQRLPVDRDACRRWWFTKLGQTLISRPAIAPDRDGICSPGLPAPKRRGTRLRPRHRLLPDRPGCVMDANRGHCNGRPLSSMRGKP